MPEHTIERSPVSRVDSPITDSLQAQVSPQLPGDLTAYLDTLAKVLTAARRAAEKRLSEAGDQVRKIIKARATLNSTPASPDSPVLADPSLLDSDEARARLLFQEARAELISLGRAKRPLLGLRSLAKSLARSAGDEQARWQAMTAAQNALGRKD